MPLTFHDTIFIDQSFLAYFPDLGKNELRNMTEIRNHFLTLITRKYPILDSAILEPLSSNNLVSAHTIKLPKAVLQQAQDFVRAAFTLRKLPEYQKFLKPDFEKRGLLDPGNYSICMSYDFHVDETGNLKLIEINTNASFLALGTLLYESRGIPLPIADFSMDEIRDNLLNELQLIGKKSIHPHIQIIDEKPQEQKLYIEFVVFQEIFKKWGWKTEIVDSKLADLKADLIYNRDTDFYLEKPEYQNLKQAWLKEEICLSPQPAEYMYLADKQRQIEWGTAGFLEQMMLPENDIRTLRKHLPTAREVTLENAEQLWLERKNIFFKPKRSFGAKHSYRGGSISRKAFEEIIDKDMLAQEFITAPEVDVQTPEGAKKMKYDLRFYAYKDRVQMAVARLYQGQVTNLRTEYGGFSCLEFT